MNDYGTVSEAGTVRFERLLPGPIERVWLHLTDSEKRGRWFAKGTMELRPGGKVELRFKHSDFATDPVPARFEDLDEKGHVSGGRVVRCEAPRLLSFTWGEGTDESEVTFELTPRGKDVLLVLTHRRLGDRATMVNVSGGWYAHLGILEDVLKGQTLRPFWSAVIASEKAHEQRIPPDARGSAKQ